MIGPDATPVSTTRSNNAKDGTWQCLFVRALLPARCRRVPPLTIFGPNALVDRKELASKIVRDGTFCSAPSSPTMERVRSLRQQKRARKRATGDDFGHSCVVSKERVEAQTSSAVALLGGAFGEARVATRSAWRARLHRGSNPPAGEMMHSCTGNALEPLDRTRHLQYSSAALTHGQSPHIAETPK